MADKEERICIFTTTNYTLEETKENGTIFNGKIEPHNAKIYTRQEAIEVMAKAICMQDNLLESCEQCLTQCDKEKQKNMCEHILKKRKDNIEPSYFDKAEAALNALLNNEE